MCIKIENDASAKPAETTKTEESPKDLMLHTILLQNNALREVPDVLGQIPSLKVIQLHGNPCAPAYENFKNFMVQNTKPSESERSEELSETKSTKIIAAKRRSFSQTEPLLYQSMRKTASKRLYFSPMFFIFFFSAENGCEVGGGVGKFFGPSLKKVRDVTLRRHNDRQRQLEQIQVDRQLQLTRDYEARANFRKTFHTRPIHARPTPLAPMGKGMKFIQYKKRQFSTIFNFIFQTAMTEFSRSGKFNLVVVRQKLQKTLWTSSRQRWIGSFIADMTLTQ